MTTPTLRRGGAVLIAGGVLDAIGYVLFPSTAASPLIRPAAGLVLPGSLLLVLGLVVFQRGQSRRAGVTGWIGAALVGVGVLVLEVPHSVLDLVALDRMQDLDWYHASVMGQAEFPAIIAIAVGEIVLGVAIARSRTYPWWTSLIIVANLAITIGSFVVPSISDLLHIPAPNYLLFGLLGTGMLTLANRREQTLDATAEPATSAVA